MRADSMVSDRSDAIAAQHDSMQSKKTGAANRTGGRLPRALPKSSTPMTKFMRAPLSLYFSKKKPDQAIRRQRRHIHFGHSQIDPKPWMSRQNKADRYRKPNAHA